jgi:hypothetical protein
MLAVNDQILVAKETMEGGNGVEEPARMIARLKGEEFLLGELERVEDRCEEETKKCALVTVMGLGLRDQSVLMTDA